MEQLRDLGTKHGTDKVGVHTFNHRNFLDIYERHFDHLRHDPITMVELGVLNGSSLRVWKDYFSSGNIIGVDIDPSRKIHEQERVEVYIGSQDSLDLLNEIKNKHPEGFDIVIDDASHINELTLKSFDLYFPLVKPGGYYVIEDTHCTYGEAFTSNFENYAKGWPGMHYNDAINYKNSRSDFDKFLLDKIESLDAHRGEIFGIHTYCETIVIEKIAY